MSAEPNRKKMILVGFSLIAAVFLGVFMIWAGTFIPGFVGGIFRSIAGVLGTPLLMEFSFALVFFLIVLILNSYRRQREGDEYVSMKVTESVEEPTTSEPNGSVASDENTV